MRRRWIAIVAGVMLSFAHDATSAEIGAEKRAEIEKLMTTTGIMQVAQQMSAAMVQSVVEAVRAAQPKLTQNGATIISREVNATVTQHVGELRERLLEVYDRYYTVEDVRALNQFYATPVGKKMISTMPLVMRDSMATGRKWGEELGPEIERRVKERCKSECISK